MKQFQLLLTATFVDEDTYTLKADTNLPNNESVQKVLEDALALMREGDSEEEGNISTYTPLTDPTNVQMVEVED